jgi:hypothetical protein
MAVIRLFLLVAVLGGLTLLVASNWSPVLPLVFLGIKTRPLPLAMWILMAIAGGGLTSLSIKGLFNLSNYLTTQKKRKPFTTAKKTSRPSSYPREEVKNKTKAYEPVGGENPKKTTQKSTANGSEWENLGDISDDWDGLNEKNEDKYKEKINRRETVTEFQDSKNYDSQNYNSQTYERPQEPKTSSKSGSSYSYGYREPKQSAPRKTESVYDADYRVIIPPYERPDDNQPQPTQSSQQDKNQTTDDSTDDEWEFLDDDDFQPNKKK